MNFVRSIFLIFVLCFYSSSIFAALSLNVKIGKLVGDQLIETSKTITSDYNRDIVVSADGLKNKIVLKLKKFSNVTVNGMKINPVQIDMKVINEMKKIIGKPQTVTSFYSKTADFVAISDESTSRLDTVNVSLNFEEKTN